MKKSSLIGLSLAALATAAFSTTPAAAQTGSPYGNFNRTGPSSAGAVAPRQTQQVNRALTSSQMQQRNSPAQNLQPTTTQRVKSTSPDRSCGVQPGHQSWNPNNYGIPTYPGRNAPLPQPGIDYVPSYGYGYGYGPNGYGYGYTPNYNRTYRYNPGPRANQGYYPYRGTGR